NASVAARPPSGSFSSSGDGGRTGGTAAKRERRRTMTGKKTLTKTSGKDLVGQTTSPSEETPQQSASDNRSTKRPEMTYGLWADRTTHIEVAVWANEAEFDG